MKSEQEWEIQLQDILEKLRNNSINELDLRNRKLDANAAKVLAKALKGNHSLTTIDLSGNKIGAEGVAVLAETLKENHSLKIMNLRWNNIGDEGAKALAETLKENHSLTILDLTINDIGVKGANALADALKENHSLIAVQLQENRIGAEGANALAAALKVNHSLKTMHLSNNSIDDGGASALAEALKINRSLTTMDLWSNSIFAKGAAALADALKENCSLTEMNLGGNYIRAEGTNALSEALKINHSLTEMDLRDSFISAEQEDIIKQYLNRNIALRDQLHQVVQAKNLKKTEEYIQRGIGLLSVTGKEGNTPLHWAAAKGHVDIVNLLLTKMVEMEFNLAIKNKNNQTPFDLAQKNDHKQVIQLLQEAIAKQSAVFDKQKKVIEHYGNIPSPINLLNLQFESWLSNQILRKSALEWIQQNTQVIEKPLVKKSLAESSLKEFEYIINSAMVEEIIQWICDPDNSKNSIAFLILYFLQIGTYEATNSFYHTGCNFDHKFVMQCLLRFLSLQSKDLNGQSFFNYNEKIKSLIKEIAKCSKDQRIFIDSMKYLIELTSLQNFYSAAQITFIFIKPINIEEILKSLDINENILGKIIGLLASYETDDPEYEHIFNKVISVAKDLEKSLTVAMNFLPVTGHKSSYTAKLITLEKYLVNLHVTTEQAARLRSKIDGWLEALLKDVPKFNEVEKRKLSKIAHSIIEKYKLLYGTGQPENAFNFFKSSILPKPISAFFDNRSLIEKFIEIAGTFSPKKQTTDDLLPQEQIHLTSQPVEKVEENFERILSFFAETEIEENIAKDNEDKIQPDSDKEEEIYEEKKPFMKTQQELNSDSHDSIEKKLEKVSGPEQAVAFFTNVFKDDNTLTTMNLKSRSIWAEGAAALANILEKNDTLLSLDLTSNFIGDEGAIALADALKSNTSLKEINLGSNNIGDKGAIALANALKENRSLTKMFLSNNNIGDKGVAFLAEALKINQSLTIITLNENKIGAEGAATLFKIFSVNHSLTRIDLTKNSVDALKQKFIQNCLDYNAFLRDHLHQNIQNDNLEMTQECIRQGAGLLSATGEEENTALHWAATKGHIDIVELLLAKMTEKKLSFKVKNSLGQTPLDLARKNDHKEVIRLLQEAIANPKAILNEEKNIIEQEEVSVENLSLPINVPTVQVTNASKAISSSETECYIQQGVNFLADEEYSEALQCFEEVLKLQPDHIPALFRKGIALQKLTRLDETQQEKLARLEKAKQVFKKVITVEDKSAEKYYQLSKNHMQETEKEQALLQQQSISSIASPPTENITLENTDREELPGKVPIPFSTNPARYHQFSQKPKQQQADVNYSRSQQNSSKGNPSSNLKK